MACKKKDFEPENLLPESFAHFDWRARCWLICKTTLCIMFSPQCNVSQSQSLKMHLEFDVEYIIKMHFLDITIFPQAFITSVLNESLNPLWFAPHLYLNSIKSFWLRHKLLFLKYWDIVNGKCQKERTSTYNFVLSISKRGLKF